MLLRRYGVVTLEGGIANSQMRLSKQPTELVEIFGSSRLKYMPVDEEKVAESKLQKAKRKFEISQKMIGMQLITHQTGPEGKKKLIRSTLKPDVILKRILLCCSCRSSNAKSDNDGQFRGWNGHRGSRKNPEKYTVWLLILR